MAAKVLLFCTVLLIVQYSASGLNCYSCGSGTDGCGTSFNSKGGGLTQVSQTATTSVCLKYVAASNTNSIARSSASVCPTTTTVASTTGTDGYTIYCCTTDLCNGSTIKSASVSFAFALVALIFFYTM